MAAWPDAVEELLVGDQAIAFAYVTPASGVVVTPVTNFAMHDRVRGTASVNTSVGAGRKLERVRRNPRVALAFHTRAHGSSPRPEYVLLQGSASLSDPVDDFPQVVSERWERAAGPVAGGPLWSRWLRVYHRRVAIEVDVERIVVWPDLACRGPATVHGTPWPSDPAPAQRPPRNGTAPRVDHGRAASRAARLPDVLLGWVGADGFPVVSPVRIGSADAEGILLDAPPEIVPEGGRRAGLTAHRFTRHVVGQRQRIHTGWLTSAGLQVRYAPHTERAYWMPASRLVYNVAVGFETRRRVRAAARRQ